MKPLEPGTLLQNRYLISRIIGKGGMGEVYLATDKRLGNEVALKRTTVGEDELLATAFEREARTLAGLRHPALTKVSDHFLEEDEQFLIMDFIDGEDLSQRLKETNKPFPLNWVLFWADQLLDALAYLHSHDPPIIHRDIKPQNLKLTGDNQIVLLDFGLSKNNLGQTKVTTSGSIVGYTPHYAPMEQIRGTGTNAKSDLYALSATLYQLLANAVPPDALTRADALLANLPDPLRSLTEMNGEISEAISAAIIKGMDMNQDRRYESARMMQKVLRRAYNKMQESMSAETIAFGIEGTSLPEVASPDAKTEVGINLVNSDVDDLVDNISVPTETPELPVEDMSGEKTEVFNAAVIQNLENSESDPVPEVESEPVTPSEDLDATIQAGAVIPGLVDDVAGETDVLLDLPSEIPAESSGAFDTSEDIEAEEPLFVAEYGSESAQDESSSFTPGGTDDFGTEDFSESTSGAVFEGDEPEVEAPAAASFAASSGDSGASQSGAAVSESDGGKSSIIKYVGILAGIGLVLFVVVGAAAAGLWYFTQGGGGGSEVPLEPEMTPIVEATATPAHEEPTPEEPLGNTDVNLENGNIDEPTPDAEPSRAPLATPTPSTRSTPRRSSTPVKRPTRRATPKPRKTPVKKKPTPKKSKTPKNAGVL
jgi:serine/threonine protein kinase